MLFYIHSLRCMPHHTRTHTHNRLTALCSGLPRWAGARRNIHPLTSITSSICYDPQHPHSSHTTHTFNGPLSGTTRVSQHQKGKPIWILLEQETVSGSGISWAICKSAPRSKQKKTTPALHHSVFYRPDAVPAAQPTVSKHWRDIRVHITKLIISRFYILLDSYRENNSL